MKDNKEINLNKSFIFSALKSNDMRLNIKSFLVNLSDNEVFFLGKECLREDISPDPFALDSTSEYLPIFLKSGGFVTLRTSPININFKKDENFNYQLRNKEKFKKNKISLSYSPIKVIEFEQLNKKLKNFSSDEFFLKIEYKYEGKEFYCITKCEYINFDYNVEKKSDENSYLQPICGYIPFEYNGKVFVSYMVKHLKDNFNGRLNILLREQSYLFNNVKGSFIKKFIKLLINKIFFFIKKNAFTKYITIENSRITFFQYGGDDV